jgi:hypothetical protein
MAEEILPEIVRITQHHFHDRSFMQAYDSCHTADSMGKLQGQWKNLWEECGLSYPSLTGTAATTYDELTEPSEPETRMKFVHFVKNKTASGKTVQLSPMTIGSKLGFKLRKGYFWEGWLRFGVLPLHQRLGGHCFGSGGPFNIFSKGPSSHRTDDGDSSSS